MPMSAEVYASRLRGIAMHPTYATLPEPARTRIFDGSRRLDVPRKVYLRRAGDAARIGFVVDGLMRVVFATEEGHELTVTWAHSGALVNTLDLNGPESGLYVQAVTDATWCDLDAAEIRRIVKTDAAAGWFATTLLEDRLRHSLEEIALFAFGDLRTRVRRRLLESACRNPDATLVAPVTHEELASSVAAARPSVSRVLGELGRAGITRATPDGVLILKPSALLKGARRAAVRGLVA